MYHTIKKIPNLRLHNKTTLNFYEIQVQFFAFRVNPEYFACLMVLLLNRG